jgi:hypothetical protein
VIFDRRLPSSFRGAPLSASPESITTVEVYGFRACAQEGASRNDGGKTDRRIGIRYTFPASEISSSRLLRQTMDRDSDTSISMKTKKLTDVLERIEAWPPEAQNELADIARGLDAGLSDGEDQPTPEELARKRRLRDISAIGEQRYDSIKEMMERDHFGAYVMINTDTSDYVVGPTISQVDAAFIERFGEDAPSWSTRIGVSIFATI